MRKVWPENRWASFRDRLMSSEASTAPLGTFAMISWANVGPEKNAIGCCFLPRAFGMISCIISRVSVWSPLDVLIMGTFSSILSLSRSRNALELCSGMQCTMKLALRRASTSHVVAFTFSGRMKSFRWVGLRCFVLMLRATSSLRVSIITLNPFLATSIAIAIPKLPLPNTVTLSSELALEAPIRDSSDSDCFMLLAEGSYAPLFGLPASQCLRFRARGAAPGD
mmetsp:Transcript_10398/g.26396  ORF Transcript_10398/g.26396 Transcript_10398/m.26396 type:complete len:224 (+) Transcript_10398:542-1213(+)